MRVSVQRQALLDTLTRVSTIVPRKTTLPIIATVLLKAKDGKLTIVGTNLDDVLLGSCKARVDKSGDICTNPDPMIKFLKAVGEASVTIIAGVKTETYDSTEVKMVPQEDGTTKYESVPVKKKREIANFAIESGNSRISLPAHSSKDYPPVPEYEAPTKAINNLADALDEVEYASARDDDRPVLRGICLRPHNGKMELATADGFRLALTTIRNPGLMEKDAILTPTAATVIRRQMKGRVLARVGVKGKGNENALVFLTKELTLVTRPIEGTFPNYQQLIPTKGKWFRCKSEDLKKALNQVTAIKTSNDIIRLKTKGKNLIVSASDDESEVQHTIPAQGRIQIGVNVRYLKDLLSHLDGEFAIRWKDSSAPIMAKHNGTTHILMPMQVVW